MTLITGIRSPLIEHVRHATTPAPFLVALILATLTAPPLLQGKDAAVPPSPSASGDEGWISLFDGRTLGQWKVTDFGGHGEVEVKDNQIILPLGAELTGINYSGDLPAIDYEVRLEAMNLAGSDFFCGLTFPVEKSFCSLIVGGWGGGVVGLSSIDGRDASENETTKFMKFDHHKWYRIRLRVTAPKIEAWIDDEKVIDVEIAGRKIGLRLGPIEESKPFGIAAWQTTAALRNIQLRRLGTK